jgi:hypothetical protein
LRPAISVPFAQQPGTPQPPGAPPQPPPDPAAPRPYEDPPRPIPIPRPDEPPVVDDPLRALMRRNLRASLSPAVLPDPLPIAGIANRPAAPRQSSTAPNRHRGRGGSIEDAVNDTTFPRDSKRLNYNDRAWSSFATRDFVSKSEANTNAQGELRDFLPCVSCRRREIIENSKPFRKKPACR